MRNFIKIHPNIQTVLTADEIPVYITLLEQDFFVRNGSTKGWSKDFMMKASGTSRRKFEKATDILVKKGLLEVRNQHISGKKNEYILKEKESKYIMDVLDESNNKPELRRFFTKLFKDGKTPLDITEEDIEFIKTTRIKWKKNKDGDYDRDRSEYNMSTLSDKNSKSEYISNNNESENDINQVQSSDMSLLIQAISSLSNKMNDFMSYVDVRLGKIEEDINTLKKQVHYVPAFDKSKYTVYTSIDNIRNNIKTSKNAVFLLFEKKKQKYLGCCFTSFRITTSLNKNNFTSGSIIYNYNNILDNQFNNIIQLPRISKNKYLFSKEAEMISVNEKQAQIEHTTFPEIKKNKTMEILRKEEHERDVSALFNYFSERYPHNSAEHLDVAMDFFDELKEEWWSYSDELNDLAFRDVFRHFKYKGDKVFMFYEKVKENELELSNSELNEFNEIEIKNKLFKDVLSSPDNEKIEYIQEKFEDAFSVGEYIELTSLNQFVLGCMRDLNAPVIQDIKYNNERLAVLILRDIMPTDPDDHYMWKRKNTNKKASSLKAVSFEKINSAPKTEYKPEISSGLPFGDCATDDENIYVDILKNFRITRRMDTSDVTSMVNIIVPFLKFSNGLTITDYDMANLMVAIAVKINTTPENVLAHSNEMFTTTNNKDYTVCY